jgi:ABC-2 type transport system ATP-binding protein
MKKDYALKVENISKVFSLPLSRKVTVQSYFVNPFEEVKKRDLIALKGLSFHVRKNEFFSVIGRNGVGKSTLLKIVAGIYENDTGTVEIDGRLVPFLELGVGFTPDLTARENVFLNGILLGLSRSEVESHLQEVFDFAELNDFKEVPVKNFSSGMQVRLAFAVAMIVPSDILVLDEVLAVGDVSFQEKCYHYFKEIKGKKTIVFVSHDLGSVQRYSDRVLYLRDNNLFEVGDPLKMIEMYKREVL